MIFNTLGFVQTENGQLVMIQLVKPFSVKTLLPSGFYDLEQSECLGFQGEARIKQASNTFKL
jgi:hypothetical protein